MIQENFPSGYNTVYQVKRLIGDFYVIDVGRDITAYQDHKASDTLGIGSSDSALCFSSEKLAKKMISKYVYLKKYRGGPEQYTVVKKRVFFI